MNILKDKKALRNFIQQGDVLNTLSGGVSHTNVDIKQEDKQIVIHVSAPGMPADSFNIFLNYNQLVIYSALKNNNQDQDTEAMAKAIPLFSRTFEIPVFVNVHNIEAVYEDGRLKVILPFKEDIENYKRNINIKYQ